MAELVKRKKALSVSPLKASQTIGASLAFLGFSRAMPIMHGSQGCTAFAKVFFVRHFREPIPLQTTAMDQVSAVMGADDNIVEALKVVAEKSSPSVIGLVTTGLAETQGTDIQRATKEFRKKHPELNGTEVVAVNTPDFSGCFESGFALAVQSIIETLVPNSVKEGKGEKVGFKRKQVNVLCNANLTPGDLEFVTESIESFGLRPLLIPDLSGSLDGHLADEGFNPLTTGGTSIADLKTAGESVATLVVGDSLKSAGKSLLDKTGVPSFHFSHLMTLDSVDDWFHCLTNISGEIVPTKWQRHRSQLQDALLDCHFMVGSKSAAIAGDGDLVIGFHDLLASIGATSKVCVIPAKAKSVTKLPIEVIHIGDLEDLENLASENSVDILIGNSHATESAERLGVPILRMGFPQYDFVGGFQRCWSGYKGITQALFDLANIFLQSHHEIQPYHSIYSQKSDSPYADSEHGAVH